MSDKREPMSAPPAEVLQYGGQAVIEGVMMRSAHFFSVACRRPDGRIVTRCEPVEGGILGKLKWLNRPLLRGTLALVDAMALGMRALTFASSVQMEAEQEKSTVAQLGKASLVDEELSTGAQPEKHRLVEQEKSIGPQLGKASLVDEELSTGAQPEKPRLDEQDKISGARPGKVRMVEEELKVVAASGANGVPMGAPMVSQKQQRINDIAISWTIVFSLAFGVLLFVLLPTLLSDVAKRLGLAGPGAHRSTFNVLDGVIRMVIFFSYILLISTMQQIRRVFKYHGAEHKAINTLEAGRPLRMDVAEKASRIHPRCGTSFIFIVLVVQLIITAFLPRPVWYLRFPLHLAIIPVVAGIAYEVIKAGGRCRRNRFVMAMFAPGMWSQYLTTRDPDPEQVEVALVALRLVIEAEGNRITEDGELVFASKAVGERAEPVTA